MSRRRRTGARRRSALACASALLVGIGAGEVAAQSSPDLFVEWADGSRDTIPMDTQRGFAALDLAVIESLGWSVAEVDQAVALVGPHDVTVVLRIGSPFFVWGDEALQLAFAPYRDAGRTRLPVQLLSDFLASRLPELYAFDTSRLTLGAADPSDWDGGGVTPLSLLQRGEVREADQPSGGRADAAAEIPATADRSAATSASSAGAQPPSGVTQAPSTYEGPRVVVIDAGHGGGDPGTVGIGGAHEKNIALAIARNMADLLSREPGIEVYMTREDDTFVPVWDRGEMATRMKGERPGLFVSIHANSFPDRRAARGFETYFLAEARNEHERRVSAIENAPLSVQGRDVDPDAEPDLGFILRELRSLDDQHWSALMAEFVQEEMERVHPGPNRGVKQGVLAVLTNVLMPSVLVEVGYISNPDEAPLMSDPDFHDRAARAISRAVVRFFERYPPGTGGPGDGE